MGVEFTQLACSKHWMQRSLERGNAPVPARTMQTAALEPRDPIWPSMELQLRVAISAVLLGKKTAEVAFDGVAADWQRTPKRARQN